MTWTGLVWLLPVMLAIAVVLGASGRRGFRTIVEATRSSFVALTLGVVAVGVVIHLIARIFS